MSALPTNHGKTWTEAARKQIVDLLLCGATVPEIAMVMGRQQDAVMSKLAEHCYVIAEPPAYRKKLNHGLIAKMRRHTTLEALHALLSEAHSLHNPTGEWKSIRFPEKYKTDAVGISGAEGVPLRNGGLVWPKSRWVDLSPPVEPGWFRAQFLTTGIDPNRKINTEPQPCKVQHVVHIDGKDFEYHPELKQQILRELHDTPIRHFKTRALTGADYGYLDTLAIAMAMAEHLDSGAKTVKPSNPTKETPMSIFKSVTTHFVNDNDASRMSDDELFAQLARGEQQLEKLKAIKTPSKKLAVQIEDMQSQLTQLAEYIDSRK